MKKTLWLLAGLLFSTAALAQQYPSKSIRMVVPFPPSGAADLTARVVSGPLGQALGQSVVLDYKAGADGAIAGNDVKNAAPDGYTILFGTNTGMCAAPVLRKSPPYDPLSDFTPVAMVGKFGFFAFVHQDVPAKSMKEFIAFARQNPGRLNYGTGNSTSIITTAQLASMEKLQMVHVPYKGDGPLSLDFIAGRVHFVIATPGTLTQYAKDGRVRALATLLPSRSPLLPDAPTMTEAGLKDIPIQPYAAIYGPKGMPKEVVDRLAKAVQDVMAQPAVKEGVARHAFEAQGSGPEQLATFHREQLDLWRRTMKDVGIQPD
jgi:tripartite-type tricarboxylate transporter receptor subunit TctC